MLLGRERCGGERVENIEACGGRRAFQQMRNTFLNTVVAVIQDVRWFMLLLLVRPPPGHYEAAPPAAYHVEMRRCAHLPRAVGCG